MNIQDIRKEYKRETLSRKDLSVSPFDQFDKWFEQAVSSDISDVNAMSLATCVSNQPHSRVVLLKGIVDGRFRFFTNYNSNKGQELDQNPNCALLFHWVELERTVRIEGVASKISEKDSTAYFLSRPKGSQISAIASNQSKVIPSRNFLEEKLSSIVTVIKPKHWGGYDIKPHSFEFWQGRSSRLHDRFSYEENEACWDINRLAP